MTRQEPRPTERGRRPRVTMVLYADPTHDGRVQREAATLADAGYDVRLLALEGRRPVVVPPRAGVEVVVRRATASKVVPGTKSPFHPGDPGTSPPVRGGRFGWVAGYAANLRSWGRWAVRTGGAPDVWHAHDFTALLALALGGLPRRAPLVYDSHELYMEVGSVARMPGPIRHLLAEIEGRMARRALGVVTVNHGVAAELARRYGVEPIVVFNCPPFFEVDRPGRMRSALGLTDEQVLLYHGAISEGRGIEVALAALLKLPSNVVFVALGDGALVPWLREQQKQPELAGRLLLHPAVPLAELLSWVVDADLGLAVFAPTEMNFVVATPNKLFECITAGVPLLGADLPEMRRIITDGPIGAVCDPTDANAVADSIGRLLAQPDELAAMAARGRKLARTTYNWDAQAGALVDLYRRVAPITELAPAEGARAVNQGGRART